MFGIGTTELIIIFLVALIVIGPKKLPEIAKTLGKAMGEFRRMSTDVKQTIEREVEMEEQTSSKEKARKELYGDQKKNKDPEEATTESASQTDSSKNDVAKNKQPEKSSSEPVVAEIEDQEGHWAELDESEMDAKESGVQDAKNKEAKQA